MGLVGVDQQEGVHMAEDDDGDGAHEEHVLPQLVSACEKKRRIGTVRTGTVP